MANSANPEINKKIATSALGTLVIATVFFYLGDRYAETLVTYPGQIFDHLSDAFLSMWQTIKDAPFALDMTSNSLLFGGACFLIIWMIWLRYVAFIGNYRSGEESGSARWGTLKEGKKFKDLQTEDNNLLFTKNFGLALHRPKFDPEYDRNLNVLVVGGSGSGKTFNYVTPNICQLNTSYFVTDPKGTLLKDAGYLFTDNGYKLKSFNTINLDESMHYNPLKYVKTDTDILSFVNCFIMNTNPEGKSSGDPFWENAEKMLYTALIALLRDWFPAKDYNMSSLLTLLSLAEARENDENFKSALDLMFLQIEEGKKYKQNDGSSPDTAGNAGLSRSFGTKQADNGWSWVPSKFKRNSDGVKPADCGGLSADEDFALMNYKNFKVAAGKTLKSILISCNVRLAPIATDGVRELLTYDETMRTGSSPRTSSSTTQTLFPSPAFTSSPRASSPSRARAASPCRQKGISMNEQLTLQSTQHEETKTVPLRRRKACLAGTFALFAACALVLLIPHPAYAGIIGDFLDIPNMIKTWLLQIAATLFNTYFGVINQTLDAKFISGPFNELFGTTEPYGVVKDFYQAGVIPVAHAILGLFMLMQLIKISQRIDATSTLPAVKDIVFLVVTYCILSYFIDNALDLVSAIYSIFNDLVGNVSDKLQSKNWYEPGIEMTKDDAADATFGGCFLLLIFGLISWAVGLVFYAVSMVVALGRSVQLYVYAAFSPIPISLLGFEETKQIGIGYLKNFAAAALAGVVMVLILYLYPHLVTALAVSGGLGKAEMLGLAQGVETFDSFGVIIKTIAVLITTMMGLVKSGSWAKEILGA